MTLSYILHELHRWLTDKRKGKKVCLKLVVRIAAVVLVLIGLSAAKQTVSASINIIGAASNDNVGSTENVQKGSNQNEAKLQSKTQQSAENIAGILGIAMVTSAGMHLYYRKKQKKCIAPLPVLYSKEETQ